MIETPVYGGDRALRPSRAELDPDPTVAGDSREYEVHETSRFGRVRVLTSSILEFPYGLIGLGGNRYALLRADATSPFVWLQSMTVPGLALPLTNPHRFVPGFAVELADDDAQRFGLAHGERADVFVTVTTGATLAEFTINTRAPVLARQHRAYQVLNQAPGAAVKTPLFPAGVR